MSRRWAVAAAMSALVVAGCGSEDDDVAQRPATAQSEAAAPDDGWRAAATAALSAWDDFPVDAEVRPIVLILETAGPGGFRTGEQKDAFESGNWSAPDDLPSTPGEVDGYPILPARDALEVLRTASGHGGNKPQGTRIAVEDVRLGSVKARTDRGQVELPAWRVLFTGSTGPHWIPAVTAPAVYQHDGPFHFGAGPVTGDGGRELTFHMGGSSGTGPCASALTAEAVESAHAVAYRLIVQPSERGNQDRDVPCPTGGGDGQTVTLRLAAPIGDRVLIYAPAANDIRGPVLVRD